jgi:hypothetical protein
MNKKKSWSAARQASATKTPINLSKDNTTDTLVLASPKTTNLVKISADWLRWRFRSAVYWIFGVREDKSMYKVPATVRGNDTYAYYQSARIIQIQEDLKNKIKIENNTTNALFITLTQKYDTGSIEAIEETWIKTRPALRKFKVKLRKMGMRDYAMTLEAHENGGCHVHMIAIFSESVKIHATKGDKYRVNNIELLYKIKKAWADALGYDMDSAFVDVLACGNDGLCGYITKELKKNASCEKAMRNVDANKDSPSDRKKILAFYFAGKHRIRLLYVSKGISATAEPEEGETPTEFITNVITESKGRRVLYTCLVRRAELLKLIKYNEISPYTGDVDAITEEYEAVMGIFEERYGISKVLKSKEETEKVIREREERKIVKMQTRMIAQEAMYG